MNMHSEAPLVRVVLFPATRLAVLEHRGSPLRLGNSIRAFIEWRKAHRLPPRLSATFNLVYDDPEETRPEDFRFGLGAATDAPIESNEAGVAAFTIPAGRCALLRHRGSDDQLGRSIQHLYSSWLPGSGEELRDFPLFMQRVAFFPDVPDSDAVTDIYLPLR
jgi:AraC family transcriptional regulator